MEEEEKVRQGIFMPEKSDPKKPDKETLLVEYQKAQDYAEHCDNLAWIVFGIVISAFAASYQYTPEAIRTGSPWILPWTAAIIASIMFVAFSLIKGYSSISRCEEIERELGMNLHSIMRKRLMEKFVRIIKIVPWVLLGFVIAYLARNIIGFCK